MDYYCSVLEETNERFTSIKWTFIQFNQLANWSFTFFTFFIWRILLHQHLPFIFHSPQWPIWFWWSVKQKISSIRTGKMFSFFTSILVHNFISEFYFSYWNFSILFCKLYLISQIKLQLKLMLKWIALNIIKFRCAHVLNRFGNAKKLPLNYATV